MAGVAPCPDDGWLTARTERAYPRDVTGQPLAFDPADPHVRRFLIEAICLPTERLWLFLLGAHARYIGCEPIGRGGTLSVHGRFRDLFKRALDREADRVVLVHNHPSGNPLPSAEDLRFTRTVVALADALDVAVVDHLIVSRRGIFTMAQWRVL